MGKAVNLLPAGNVSEVLAGGGVDKREVQAFLRSSHHADSHAGVSFVAIGVLPSGAVWLLTDGSEDELTTALRDAHAVDAEVIRLENLQ